MGYKCLTDKRSVVPKDDMMITKQIVSEKLLAYLDEQVSFNQIISWAEQVVAEGNYTPDSDIDRLVNIVTALAAADRPRIVLTRDAA